MRKILITDCTLVLAWILSTYSGIGLHIAGQGSDHATWHNWAVAHVIGSTLFLVAAISHVKAHWAWYKSVWRKGVGPKSRVTLLLSAAFLATSATGIALLGVHGANSSIGQWHYAVGLATALLSAGHTIKRIPALRKLLAANGKHRQRSKKPA